MPVKFTLPCGRIVSGSPTFLQTKDMQGNTKDKPNIFFAVAVPKQNCNEILGMMFAEGMNFYRNNPKVAPQISMGFAGKFAWKVEDGDKPEHANKEGYAGCYIFKLSTTLGVPPCFDVDGRSIDPTSIKRGYFVEVYVTCAANELPDINAGLYLNPDGVLMVAYGHEITSGPTFEQMFGRGPRPVPPGGSLTPLGPSPQPAAALGFGQPQPQPQQGFGQPQPAAPGFNQPQPQQGFGQPQGQSQQGFGQPQGQPQQGFNQPQGQSNPFAAAVQGAQDQRQQGNADWAGHSQSRGTVFPGNPQTFPGR